MTPPFCPESGKIRHPSQSAAMKARPRDGDSRNLEAYWCDDCEAWHLGHSAGCGRRRNQFRRRGRRTNRKGLKPWQK